MSKGEAADAHHAPLKAPSLQYISKKAEKKIKEAGGAILMTA